MHSPKFQAFFKEHLQIAWILALFFLVNLATLSFYHDIGWDSSVYIGMGKYIYSMGQSGIWEPIRPLTIPLILGFFWKIGLDPVIFGKLLILSFSIGVITLTYILSTKLFGKQTAIIASIILSFSALLLSVSHEILVEIPAVFFLLSGFYFYLEKKYFYAGIWLGLAFLTKFPTILLIFAIVGMELLSCVEFRRKFFLIKLQALSKVLIAFALIILPYLLFNYYYYHDALLPLKSAKGVIDNVVGCTVLDLKPSHYYFPLLFKDNPLHLFFIFGMSFVLLGKKEKYKINKMQILVYIAAFFIYFTLLVCKTDRYPILALPFISVITGYGISSIYGRIIKKEKYNILIIIIIFLISIFMAGNIIWNNQIPKEKIGIFSYFRENGISGEILTTTPQIAAFTDSKLEPIYYYDSSRLAYYMDYITKNKHGIAYVFVNTGGIPCHPSEPECPRRVQDFMKFLSSNLKTSYHKKIGGDEYFIFSPI